MGYLRSTECSQCSVHGPDPWVLACAHLGDLIVRVWVFEDGRVNVEGPARPREWEVQDEADTIRVGKRTAFLVSQGVAQRAAIIQASVHEYVWDPRLDGHFFNPPWPPWGDSAWQDFQARCAAMRAMVAENK